MLALKMSTCSYWLGMNLMRVALCGAAVLLFVPKVDLYGWYRTLANVLTLPR